MEKVTCSNCGFLNDATARFCKHCGTPCPPMQTQNNMRAAAPSIKKQNRALPYVMAVLSVLLSRLLIWGLSTLQTFIVTETYRGSEFANSIRGMGFSSAISNSFGFFETLVLLVFTLMAGFIAYRTIEKSIRMSLAILGSNIISGLYSSVGFVILSALMAAGILSFELHSVLSRVAAFVGAMTHVAFSCLFVFFFERQDKKREEKAVTYDSENGEITVAEPAKNEYSRVAAAIICFFFGGFGIHRFYVGKVGTGILWLLTGGLFGIGSLVDFIIILTGGFKDKNGKAV